MSHLSGNKNYFYELKNSYLVEIQRLNEVNTSLKYKAKEWKEKYVEKNEELLNEISKYEKEIELTREKYNLRASVTTQTEVDRELMQKYYASYDIHIYNKRIAVNVLDPYFENIKYGTTKQKALSKEQLNSLMVDVYMYKLEIDGLTKTNRVIDNFDRVFYEFMLKEYKFKTVAENKIEETLLALNKYSGKIIINHDIYYIVI